MKKRNIHVFFINIQIWKEINKLMSAESITGNNLLLEQIGHLKTWFFREFITLGIAKIIVWLKRSI